MFSTEPLVKLGVSSYTFTWAVGVPGREPARPMDAFALLPKAAALGVHVVQIADNLPLHRLAPAELDSLGCRAAEHGIALEVGTRGTATDHLRAYLEIARCLGASLLRTVVDTADHRPEAREVPGLLAPFVPHLKEARVHLAIENHDRFPAATFAEIIRQVGSPWVGICLDTGNSWLGGSEPIEYVKTFGRRIKHVHWKDMGPEWIPKRSTLYGCGMATIALGDGVIDLPAIVEALQDVGFDGPTTLEIAGADNVKKSIERLRKWNAS